MIAALVERAQRTCARRPAYAIAALLGLAIHVFTFGPGHILGTSPYWDMPYEDFRAYMIGYRYFLHEPWQLPLFTVHGMNVPYPKSIAMTDSIPLWALINKAIATVIPPWAAFSERAYIGLWGAVVAMLQGITGLSCLRALGHRSIRATVAGSLFFVALPTFVYRYGHSSLSAHFVILIALSLYLRTPAGRPARWTRYVAYLVLFALGSLVNIYVVAMALAIFVALVLRSKHLVTIVLWPVAALGTVAVLGWIAGFLSREASKPMGGFEWSSTNLLSPIIPMQSGIFGNRRDIAEVVAAPYQYEGYAYLGLGVILLALLLLPRIRRLGGVISRHRWLFVIILATSVFALSNHVYFGSHRIVAIEVTGPFKRLTEIFRAPGRFVWLPTYVLVTFLVHAGLGVFSRGWNAFVVPVLALLEVADATGDMKFWRDQTRKAHPHFLPIEPWKKLESAHTTVQSMPAYDCALDGTPHVDRVGMELGYLSSESGVTINSVYSARSTRDCAAEVTTWSTEAPQPGTLYVVLPRVAKEAFRFEAAGAKCGRFEFGRACSLSAPAIDAAISSGALQPNLLPPAIAIGEQIDLGGAASTPHVDYGFTNAESVGRWTIGARSSLLFRIESADAVIVHLSTVICPARPLADVDIDVNRVLAGSVRLSAENNDASLVRRFEIPKEARSPDGIVQLDFRAHDWRPPKSFGCGTDDRPVGVRVDSIAFE